MQFNTLQHHNGPPTYLSGSIMGHGGTLRRSQQPHEMNDATIPRSLTRASAENAQYYYG